MSKPIFTATGILSAAGVGLFIFALSTSELHSKDKKGKDIGIVKKYKDELKKLKNFRNEDNELNPELIDFYQSQAKLYEEENEEIKQAFQEKNSNIESFFDNIKLKKAGGLPDSSSQYRIAYERNLKDLSQRYIQNCGADPELDKHKISESLTNVSYLKNWGSGGAKTEEQRPSMVKFNILNHLYSSLRDSNLYYLKNISITPPGKTSQSPRGNNKTNKSLESPYYDLIPVTITCELEVKNVTRLLSNLLRNENIIIQLDKVSLTSTKGFQFKNKEKLKNGVLATLDLNILLFNKTKIKVKRKSKKR